ncbi:MAG TPA: glycoside hydrolase family 16 protein [Candidatus Limnocylindrales bacterium]|jgi:beta-glucanase (GH16 family)|nr:glycoside hydrolase family 16 protein [Bryobacteraceae bacterium]HXJ11371.1 glycoside hydrolase family 16 protein [Candidatus Limnocylindrales bacterium]
MTTRFVSLIWFLLIVRQALAAPPYWTLIWSDEFDGPAGTAPDPNKWVFDLGAGGWGNQELENYTSGHENSYLDGAGNLVIIAREAGPGQYTSARLKTLSKFAVKYGRIEARMKLPAGQGMWPAFWMMGVDAATAGWPQCGEIDIMENIGREPFIVHATVHGPGYSGSGGITQSYKLPDAQAFAADYHIFATEWSQNNIEFLVDGHLYHTVTPAALPTGAPWVFQHPFFLLLNLAVGGSWPENPDTTTVFPQQMLVDYVRVYQHRGRVRMK